VVGVIVSLALFFAQHVFVRASGQWDTIAVTLTVVACVAVFRFKLNTILLILIAGAIGAALKFAHII
jgi:chromate transporter